MSRPALDRHLKWLDAQGGLDRFRVGTADVGSPALAEKADVGTRLFLGVAIDWLPYSKRTCRLLRVPHDVRSLLVLTVDGRREVLAAATSFECLRQELERLELDAAWIEAPAEEVAR